MGLLKAAKKSVSPSSNSLLMMKYSTQSPARAGCVKCSLHSATAAGLSTSHRLGNTFNMSRYALQTTHNVQPDSSPRHGHGSSTPETVQEAQERKDGQARAPKPPNKIYTSTKRLQSWRHCLHGVDQRIVGIGCHPPQPCVRLQLLPEIHLESCEQYRSDGHHVQLPLISSQFSERGTLPFGPPLVPPASVSLSMPGDAPLASRKHAFYSSLKGWGVQAIEVQAAQASLAQQHPSWFHPAAAGQEVALTHGWNKQVPNKPVQR